MNVTLKPPADPSPTGLFGLRRKDFVAGAMILGFLGVVGALIFHGVPEANKALFYTLAGILGTKVSGIVDFDFGSSAGSQAKDATISQAISNQPKDDTP